MEFLFIAAVIGLIPAAIAKSKGHNFFTWWLFGFLLWIVAMPCSLFLKENLEVTGPKKGLMKCPKCLEWIQNGAIVCKHCKQGVLNEIKNNENFKF
jgi:hypothetical protein